MCVGTNRVQVGRVPCGPRVYDLEALLRQGIAVFGPGSGRACCYRMFTNSLREGVDSFTLSLERPVFLHSEIRRFSLSWGSRGILYPGMLSRDQILGKRFADRCHRVFKNCVVEVTASVKRLHCVSHFEEDFAGYPCPSLLCPS